MFDFKHIDVTQTKTMLDSQQATIVDIRDGASFKAGHIPGALHLTNENLTSFIANADKMKPLIVVCYHGHSSQEAARYLAAQGFNEVFSMDGGAAAWQLRYSMSC